MGALIGIRGQQFNDRMFDASGTIASGATAQLVLPQAITRSSLIFQNLSDTVMYLEIGPARAGLATLSSGAVSSVAMSGTNSNVGFGYSKAPSVVFLGGLLPNRASNPTYTLQGLPDYPAPSRPAKAHCVMTGSAPNQTVSSIVIDDPGAGYAYPPLVYLENDPTDPFGAAAPATGTGIYLAASGGSYTANGSVCPTGQISVICSGSGKAFVCKYSL